MIYRKLLPQESPRYRLVRLACLEKEPDHFGTTVEEEAKALKLKYESIMRQDERV